MGTTKPKRYGRRYPWDQWFAAGKFTIRRGVDFACLPHGMAQMIRNVAAAKFRVRVTVAIRGDNKTIDVEVH